MKTRGKIRQQNFFPTDGIKKLAVHFTCGEILCFLYVVVEVGADVREKVVVLVQMANDLIAVVEMSTAMVDIVVHGGLGVEGER